MPRRIWSNPGNPPASVARQLGLDEYELGDRLHAIKEGAGLGGADRVSIWDDGAVTDDNAVDDEDVWIGNLRD